MRLWDACALLPRAEFLGDQRVGERCGEDTDQSSGGAAVGVELRGGAGREPRRLMLIPVSAYRLASFHRAGWFSCKEWNRESQGIDVLHLGEAQFSL